VSRRYSLHPAIEVPASRYEEFTRVGTAQLIADANVLGDPRSVLAWIANELSAFGVLEVGFS
jgi:2-keto-4-pentenoate hydratase